MVPDERRQTGNTEEEEREVKTIDSKYRAGLMMEGHVSMSLGVVSPTPRSQAGDRHPLGSSGTVGRRQDGIPDQC